MATGDSRLVGATGIRSSSSSRRTHRNRAGCVRLLVGDIPIAVTRKRIKHVHLRVHPPDGRVTISAPMLGSTAGCRSVRRHSAGVDPAAAGPRARTGEGSAQTVRQGESHYLWGHRHVLSVVERDGAPGVILDDRPHHAVHPTRQRYRRARSNVMHAWHKSILHDAAAPLIQKWEQRLNVHLTGYYLRRMKTRWGTCNYRTDTSGSTRNWSRSRPPARVRAGARDGAPDRAESWRPLRCPDERALSVVARSAGGTYPLSPRLTAAPSSS